MRRAFDVRGFPGFAIRATRAFWVFFIAVPALALAALNTGNNALYLLLSLALGAFVASGALSRHTLRSLRAEVRPPGEVFAGGPVALAVEVANVSRWLPAAGVVVRLHDMPGHALVPTVPPRGTAAVRLVTVFAHRGRFALPALRVEVRLPLGFFVKAVHLEQAAEALVYPRRFAGAAARLAGAGAAHVTAAAGGLVRGGEVEQLREFRPGDDRRDIHWKQTARQQRLIVVERRERSRPAHFLVLDRQLPRRDDWELLARFEDLVSEVATAALDRIRRGDAVGLVIGGSVTPPQGGRRQARRLLEQLALVQAVGPGDDPLPAAIGGAGVYRLAESR
jgi:uncharacterized protein (DUF58 family)